VFLTSFVVTKIVGTRATDTPSGYPVVYYVILINNQFYFYDVMHYISEANLEVRQAAA